MPDARRLQASKLQARADALERELAGIILNLDDDAVERLALAALEIGFEVDEVRAIFERAARPALEEVWGRFAESTVIDGGLPPATAAVAQEGEIAIGALLDDLTDEGQAVVARLTQAAQAGGWGVQKLAGLLRAELPLDERRNGWIDNYERKLRIDARRTLAENTLRDRRADRRLRRDPVLSESEVQSLVARYRGKMIRSRALAVARQELLRASNGAHYAAWQNAEKQGSLPKRVRKFWWNMHDTHVRHSHQMIPGLNPDGVALADSFVTPLGYLRYPLDPSGVAEDVLGCRCILIVDTANPEGGL